MKTTFTENDATYTTHEVKVLGNTYHVTIVTGRYNYICIQKITNNPWLTAGIEFANFDEAVKHYKSAEMKIALLKIEMNF